MPGQVAMVGGTWPPFGRFSERYGADTVQMEWLPPSSGRRQRRLRSSARGLQLLASGVRARVHEHSQNKEAPTSSRSG